MPNIDVDFRNVVGRIKRLHGVNNGPVAYGGVVNVTRSYREAGIPLVRLHDPNWPHPWEVDIHTIFTDFNCDADAPESYDFALTDEYVESVLATGSAIVFRLGTSIEHTPVKRFTHPPQDFGKWSQICANIIRHYTAGWADGYEFGDSMHYWEIWNEPDIGDQMWTGSEDEYFELYRVASSIIRRECPNVKVGGCAVSNISGHFASNFLSFVQANGLPFDFFSWHCYADNPGVVLENIAKARRLLDEYGFRGVESHLNEWNYFDCPEGWEAFWGEGGAHIKRRIHTAQKDESGASFVATVLLEGQDLPINAANYYDGQPGATFCGLFDQYGVEQKTCLAFKAFNHLASLGMRAEVRGQAPVSCCAAKGADGSGKAIMLANFDMGDQACILNFHGTDACDAETARLYRISAENDFQCEEIDVVGRCGVDSSATDSSATGGSATISLPSRTVALVTMG